MTAQKPERRLLIIDDEPELLEILVDTCRSLTPHVVSAQNGLEGLGVIQSQKIHAILSDINMPKMSGLQLLAKIREMGNETPFIFLTGYNDRENSTKALQLGATDFHEKPYHEESLLASIDLALDLGVALETFEKEIEEALAHSKLPKEQLEKVKKARREIWKIKTTDEFFKRKPKVS